MLMLLMLMLIMIMRRSLADNDYDADAANDNDDEEVASKAVSREISAGNGGCAFERDQHQLKMITTMMMTVVMAIDRT